MKKYKLLFIGILHLILVGCSQQVSAFHLARKTSNWTYTSLVDLRKEIDRSKCYEVWNYCGSDNEFHYFLRQARTMNPLCRKEKLIKVNKYEVKGIVQFKMKEKQFNGNDLFIGVAFTKRAEKKCYDHSILIGVYAGSVPPL